VAERLCRFYVRSIQSPTASLGFPIISRLILADSFVLRTRGQAKSARCRWMLVRLDHPVGLYRLCSETWPGRGRRCLRRSLRWVRSLLFPRHPGCMDALRMRKDYVSM
jgi:hypothetical protein